LEQWLTDNGYDGLYAEECGCIVGDLAPCGEPCSFGCRAGHLAEGCCECHIGKKG